MRPSPRPWLFSPDDSHLPLSASVTRGDYLADETAFVEGLLAEADRSADFRKRVKHAATELVEQMRRQRSGASGLDAFLAEYDLSSAEGTVLLCLAEALLRIPDAETADDFIAEKLGQADWQSHLGRTDSLFVNASTWALMLTGQFLYDDAQDDPGWIAELGHAVNRLGEPVVRTALKQAMRILGRQFVMGQNIAAALQRTRRGSGPRYRYSFDMLGEAAVTADDASRYFATYRDAILAVSESSAADVEIVAAPSVSVKLSALSPRFEFGQSRRAVTELSDRVLELAITARKGHVGLTIDAEEADRLELSLEIFARVLAHSEVRGWPGLGVAVQAYQKRAIAVIDWLAEHAAAQQTKISVRLVKGAYWDSEIKLAQAQGLSDYPVFTRKSNTDLSYLACAARLLDAAEHFFPQFATHNAYTVAWLLERGKQQSFEFQRLHGMGEELYHELVESSEKRRPCRVYAPVGSHADLLPYLVRRLLENGANTSFVNRFVHAEVPAAEVVEDPIDITEQLRPKLRHPRIVKPEELFGAQRRNSHGLNLADYGELAEFAGSLEWAASDNWLARPIIDGTRGDGEGRLARDPANWEQPVGEVIFADAAAAKAALGIAVRAQAGWNAAGAAHRAALLRSAADAFEANRADLVARCVREGGRTVADSLAEVREAVDFLRYYAAEAERLLAAPLPLPGVTGESNVLRLQGRGVFLCISPWNFPLAIFVGQLAAALGAGNAVLAKPAEQTNLVAYRAVELLLEAGIPANVLHFLPGDGATIGAALLGDERLAGVAFTGSTQTAAHINRELAQRSGALVTLIAETGGINAMLVDSSALPEQVVKDVLQSAFNSAGQRCSALRLLCLQEDTAERVLEMLEGGMRELVLGDPCQLNTDIGPVIDAEAREMLEEYLRRRAGRIRYQCPLGAEHAKGLFVAPTLLELDRVADLTREIFGPVLHVVRYGAGQALELVDEINRVGYGLTLGIHSRVESFAQAIAARARVGNVYVNRNIIGAQVGAQPFGGMGLSGTGPKAGGPRYLERFLVEQVVSTNTAAVGGNATLFAASADD